MNYLAFNFILGSNRRDTLSGGSGNDLIKAKDGRDYIVVTQGEDTLRGNRGDDTFIWPYIESHDSFRGRTYAEGGRGDDSFSTHFGEYFIDCGKGSDSVYAGLTFNSTNLQSAIYGGSGKDYLYGSGNDDLINGGKGVDFLLGGAGDDTLIGGSQRDNLRGGAGSDLFVASKGSDEIDDFNPREDKISGFYSPRINRTGGSWTTIRETIDGNKYSMKLYLLSDDDYEYLLNNFDSIFVGDY